MIPLAGWVAPFGDPGIADRSHLPRAFRSVLRPSSPLSAKASTRCPSHALLPRPTASATRVRLATRALLAVSVPAKAGTHAHKARQTLLSEDTSCGTPPGLAAPRLPLRSHNSLLYDGHQHGRLAPIGAAGLSHCCCRVCRSHRPVGTDQLALTRWQNGAAYAAVSDCRWLLMVC